ncbi:MAG: ACR3 family arsenite efflux transporter [Bacilli bacterium]
MKLFDKLLSVWVLLCMAIGVLLGKFVPAIPEFITKFEVYGVNIIIAILLWVMIYPMMLKIDFKSVKEVGKNPKGLFLTWIVNWLIKPFTMYGIAFLFFMVIYKGIMPDVGQDYLAGAILLGVAPCTAMVFVWSSLTKGNAAYTLVQVATNDLIILLLYVPISGLLLGVGGFSIPWGTLFFSVLIFIVVPMGLAVLTRWLVVKKKGETTLNNVISKTSKFTTASLLLTLVIIFTLQADLIWENPLHILLIAIPLTIQTFFIFGISYGAAKLLKLPHDIASPAAMVGASNFFELAVAVAITLFPDRPGVALATIVGVLVEVPTMLLLVQISNKTKGWFDAKKAEIPATCGTQQGKGIDAPLEDDSHKEANSPNGKSKE